MLPPSTYKTIKQARGSRLCVACVAAMAVGKGLRYAMNRMTPTRWPDGRHYYKVRELLKFLGQHGICPGLIFGPPPGPVTKTTPLGCDVPLKARPAVLSIPSAHFPNTEHMLFWDGDVVRDPDPDMPDTVSLVRYRIVEIMPLTYLDERPTRKATT